MRFLTVLIALLGVARLACAAAPCSPTAFVLDVAKAEVPAATRDEVARQLNVGLDARGFGVCGESPDAPIVNAIHLTSTSDGGQLVIVRYHGRSGKRIVNPQATDPWAMALEIAVAAEELVVSVAGPSVDEPPPAQPPADPRFRIGAGASLTTFEDTHLGVGFGGRLDYRLAHAFRVSTALDLRTLASAKMSAGQARYTWLDAQIALHHPLVHEGKLTLVAGLGAAPVLVFGSGKPTPDYASQSATRVGAIGRLLIDGELAATEHQTVVLRLAVGRPLVAVRGSDATGGAFSGLSGFEATVGLAWLWSLGE